jgi:seryl-tRNA(Sec) selenium transferase
MPIAQIDPPDSTAGARRQRNLLIFAWSLTLLPLAAFVYLSLESYRLQQAAGAARTEVVTARRSVEELQAQAAALRKQLATDQEKLQEQRSSTRHYRDVAGIRIQFYRESDRQTVEAALQTLGFRVETSIGQSRLIQRKSNTIAFGNLVSAEDLREVAVALVQAGLPLRRIQAAVKQTESKLIQIFASADADLKCGPLTVAQIRQGETCGPRS